MVKATGKKTVDLPEQFSKNAFFLLFIEQLGEMLQDEKLLIEAMPVWIQNTTTPELKILFENHLEETRYQVSRLNDVFKILQIAIPKDESGIDGQVNKSVQYAQKNLPKYVKDSAFIASALKIDQYEVASYGTLVAIAKEFGLKNVVSLLQDSLREENNAFKQLKKISQGSLFSSGINQMAKDEVI